jgi:cysteine-rich repeat protein
LTPNCGNGTIEPSEECDDGVLNSDTTPDACRSNCRLAGCGDGVEDTAIADFVFVIETSLSMGGDLKRIPTAIGALPEMASAAGIDYRVALVRFGTGKLRNGSDVPDLMLDFTTEGDFFRSALTALRPRLTGPTESGTEALDFALDNLQLRPNAIPIFLLITDEDDDLPVFMERGRRREPPPKWLTDARTPQFQTRIDAVAQRLRDSAARAVFLMKPRNRPSEFQYGAPRLAQFDGQGRFDGPQTLLALAAEQMQTSLQGQLLGAGRCDLGRCVEGSIGYTCTGDEDCGLYARAHDVKTARRRSTREEFYAALLFDLLDLAHCQP